MLRQLSIIALSAGMMVYALTSCKHEPFTPVTGNFPEGVREIMISKCAITGCHDAAGAVNAAKLRLDSWEELFKGSSHGAVVVPYTPKYSSLLYYINQDAHSNDDIVASPRMPYNMGPLTETEYNTIKNWIANGAPDANGKVAFAEEAETRQKIYMVQQGCVDLLSVVDAKSGLVMRCVELGATNNIELPHYVKVSPDGRYAYICFFQGRIVQKLDTRTDQLIGTVEIGDGNWNVLNISDDGTKLLVSGTSNGELVMINTTTMSVIENFNGLFTQPHGLATTPSFDTVYISSQYGNTIYRYTFSNGDNEPITLDGNPETHTSVVGQTPDPHELLMSPDHTKLFVTCQNNATVKIIDLTTLQVIQTLAVGAVPKELAISKKKNQVYVTCMEDANNNYSSKSRGSVYVIDLNTLQLVGNAIYGDFYQPHGIAVDEQTDKLYIVSRNENPNGPAPHHSSTCNGRNGWYTVYDLNTLQPFTNIRYEVAPDPYGADVRFK